MRIKEIHFWTPGVLHSDCYIRVDNKSPDWIAKMIRYQVDEEKRTSWEFVDRETNHEPVLLH